MRSLLFVLLSVVISHAFSADELSPEEKRKLNIEFHSDMAASRILKLAAIEKKFLALPTEQRDVALLATAGLVNTKIGEWGKKKIDAGEMTQRQFAYVFSNALSRLAILAQTVGLNAAVQCHFKEAKALAKMSESGQPESANCRVDVYGPDVQARATKLEFTDSAPKIRVLANEWATEAILYGQDLGQADNFGAGPKATLKSKATDGSVSVSRNFEAADESGKVAICAPIFTKMAMMIELGLEKKRQDGQTITSENANSLFQVAFRAELFNNLASMNTKAMLDKAWKDSAADKTLRSSEGLYRFGEQCFDLAKKIMTSPSLSQDAKARAVSKAKETAMKFKN